MLNFVLFYKLALCFQFSIFHCCHKFLYIFYFAQSKPCLCKQYTVVAYTYSVSKGEYALFVDGVLKSVRKTSVDKKKIPPVPIENFSPLLIGSMPDYFPMKGEIACVRIYDRALSPQELDGAERDRMRKLLSFLASDAEKSGETSLAGLLRKNAADPSLSLKSLQDLQKEHQSRCGGKKGTAPGKA